MNNWKDRFPKENRYFETDNGILYCADCLEILSLIPDESTDLILTDPPYMISQEGKEIIRTYKYYKWKGKRNIKLDFGKWDRYWQNEKDYFIWVEQWFKELVRVAKRKVWFYIFFDKQKIGIFDLYLAPKYNLKSRTVYVWIKSNPTPSFRKVNWISGTEFIWVGSKGEGKLKNFLEQKYMANYMITSNASAYKDTNHLTEKPIKLIKHLIEVNTYKNEIVLDPFLGSGTTAVACERLNRRWVGIEIDKTFCEVAKKRISKEIRQLKLNFSQ